MVVCLFVYLAVYIWSDWHISRRIMCALTSRHLFQQVVCISLLVLVWEFRLGIALYRLFCHVASNPRVLVAHVAYFFSN